MTKKEKAKGCAFHGSCFDGPTETVYLLYAGLRVRFTFGQSPSARVVASSPPLFRSKALLGTSKSGSNPSTIYFVRRGACAELDSVLVSSRSPSDPKLKPSQENNHPSSILKPSPNTPIPPYIGKGVALSDAMANIHVFILIIAYQKSGILFSCEICL